MVNKNSGVLNVFDDEKVMVVTGVCIMLLLIVCCQVLASAVLTISAEIQTSRARLAQVITRLEVAEKMAEKRGNYIKSKMANAQKNSNLNKNTIPFEFQQNEQDFHHKAGIYSVI